MTANYNYAKQYWPTILVFQKRTIMFELGILSSLSIDEVVFFIYGESYLLFSLRKLSSPSMFLL